MGLSEHSKDIIAGTTGGIAQVLVGQPFDIVKVRVQTSPPGMYSGVVDCVTKTFKNEGPFAFYKGTLMPLLGVGACVSVQFAAVGALKRTFSRQNVDNGHPARLTHGQIYVAGAGAGLANSFIAGPVEHIRIRMQTQRTQMYKGPFDCLAKIMRQTGIAGVFRGQVPTMLRESHGVGVYFLTYEYLVERKMREAKIERHQLPNSTPVIAGAAAGVAVRVHPKKIWMLTAQLWLMIYPIDVVKSCLQTDPVDPKLRQFRGMTNAVRQLYTNGGIGAFFRGVGPTIMRAPFANAATFLAFELAMYELRRY